MTLKEMFWQAKRKSYYSRPDNEVWEALNYAADKLYKRVLKELRGYWIKWDLTTIAITAGTDEYACPADLGQLVRMRERASTSISADDWRTISPAEFNSSAFLGYQGGGPVPAVDSPASNFVYYGPYELQADAVQSPQAAYKVRFAPMPSDPRAVELVYAAKFLEIANENSKLMIPQEGHQAMLAWALGELLRSNNDSASQNYSDRGDADCMEFLTFVRMRQIQELPTQEPYIDVMD